MRVKEVLCQYPEVFSGEVGRTRVIEHQIHIKDTNPVALNAYGYSREKNELIAEMVRDMEEQGFVEPRISPWVAPVVLVKKKDGSRRFCVDYRRLNMQTESDAHPMRDLHDMGFDFKTPTQFSIACGILREYRLTSKPRAESLGATPVLRSNVPTKEMYIRGGTDEMPGHVVDSEGIDRDPEKLKAIQELPVPKKTKDVLRVLGVCGWYSQFVPHYAEITAPLTSLLAKGTKWRWSEIEKEAFRKLN
ncbi:Uncharacterized protein FWK35_00020085 [Aphis craccivora]|uniref:RNA-directed DNA polymerase n=1 Tax=Aphis craccivora TaxID=307492 RepID=A0A6G0Y254_APHCR|nr:Uncharacterized protein FWK35_00020085 [Aphis craccivora]